MISQVEFPSENVGCMIWRGWSLEWSVKREVKRGILIPVIIVTVIDAGGEDGGG